MYTRVARKYRWATLAWALMKNHHHFALRLSEGGLSEGMQELHGGYSRWIHELYGQTRKGHLFRHAFYAREIEDDADLIATCTYIDLNPASNRPTAAPLESDWCSYAATIGRTRASSMPRACCSSCSTTGRRSLSGSTAPTSRRNMPVADQTLRQTTALNVVRSRS
jgi:hypothetical protein